METALRDAVTSTHHSDELPVNIPTSAQIDKLEPELEEYRTSLLDSGDDHYYCGPDITSGFSEAVAHQIVKDCTVYFSFESFVSRYHFPSRQIASNVWEILCTCLERDGLSTADIVSLSTDEESEELSFSDSEFQEAHFI